MKRIANIIATLTLSLILVSSGITGMAFTQMTQSEATQEAEAKHQRESISYLSLVNQSHEQPVKSKYKNYAFFSSNSSEKVVSQAFRYKEALFIRHCVLLI